MTPRSLGMKIEDGMFLSASLKAPVGGTTEIHASALVAAAGGFEANIEWLKEYWGEAADNFLIRGTPYNRGSILKMLLANGVQEIGDPTQCHAVAIDARAPKFDGGIITRHDLVVFGIVVNKHAQRFYDEGEDIWPNATRSGAGGGRPARTRSPTSFSIRPWSRASCRRCSRRSRAAPIAELAGKLGLDPAALEKTLADFNAAVRPARSTTPSWTIAAPKASRRRRRTGRARSIPRLISPIRCGPASPSPISAPA